MKAEGKISASRRVMTTIRGAGVEAWQFLVHAVAAVPRLLKLMMEASAASTPVPNPTILEEDDRDALVLLCWMMSSIHAREQLGTSCSKLVLVNV